jgi:hypothetical protein
MAEAEDMTVTGTADMTMIGGEEDMTVIGTADITMTGAEEDMTVTGTADLTMAGIEGTTKKDNSRINRYNCTILVHPANECTSSIAVCVSLT